MTFKLNSWKSSSPLVLREKNKYNILILYFYSSRYFLVIFCLFYTSYEYTYLKNNESNPDSKK